MKRELSGISRLCARAALAGTFVLSAALLTGSGRSQEQAPARRPAVVAVVDVAAVLRHSAQWRDAAEESNRLGDDRKRTIGPLARQVKALEAEVGSKPPGTKEREEAQEEYRKAVRELERVRVEMDTRIARHADESRRSMFAVLSAASAAVARQKGIDVVLRSIGADEGGGQRGAGALWTTHVFYAAPELDITDDIVARLNADYAAPIEVE